MLSSPIRNNEALILTVSRGRNGHTLAREAYLEAELCLEDAVQGLTIGAPVRVIDAIVRAHNIAATSVYSILEWPRLFVRPALRIWHSSAVSNTYHRYSS